MTRRHTVIQQILALATPRGIRCRQEIESELRDHFEDLIAEARSQGYDEALSERMAAIRFGDALEIAAAFGSVYGAERWSRRTIACGLLLLAAVGTVLLAVGTVQCGGALLLGLPITPEVHVFPWELLGLGAIVLGYSGGYLAERLFPSSCGKAVSLGIGGGFCIGASLLWASPAHGVLPCVAVAASGFARALQRVPVPGLWFAGTAAPLSIAWFTFRPLLPGYAPPAWLLWTGLTVSCAGLRAVVRLFERQTSGGTFA